MISTKMEKQLNEQINKELYSAYLYMAMSAWASNNNLDGVANFFKVQAQEEVVHAMKIYGYVNEQGGKVVLDAINKPQTDYKDVEQLFELSLQHEKTVTASIHTLVDLAISENDHATNVFLQWFVKEQVEEEASMDGILNKVKLAGKTGHALLMIDEQLGKREG